MAKQVTNTHKAIATTVATALGAQRPPIVRFADAANKSDIFILEAVDSPQAGVTTYATVGLSDCPLYFQGKEFATRVELVIASFGKVDGLAEALSTAAFCVVNSHWFCGPGIIFPDIVASHHVSDTLSDLYFVPPFLWENLATTDFEDRKVAWLMAMPIAKSEADFAQKYGPVALEKLFEEKNIDVFDLNRPSVVV